MASFEEYVQDAKRAKTPDELFGVFTREMSKYGYNKVLFALLTKHKDINLKAGVGIIQNYPADWMKYYFQNALDKIDPIPIYAIQQTYAFKWDQVPKRLQLTREQDKCLNMGIEAGLNNGIGIPLWGPNREAAGISLATTEKKDACHFDKDLITAYCNHFYVAFKQLHDPRPVNPNNLFLTPRERDVLTLAAIGKKDDEIAEILDISENTVNFHYKNMYERLDANNKVFAVVRAIAFGLIDPY